ncbi:MAG: hypothetical protein LBG78_01030 [Azoarcus sp.]|nr:hypothetical protein [Azoarcus sp.]
MANLQRPDHPPRHCEARSAVAIHSGRDGAGYGLLRPPTTGVLQSKAELL